MTVREHHSYLCQDKGSYNIKASKAGAPSSRRQYLTRDALVDHSCCGGGSASGTGSCTHYHNHYETKQEGLGQGGPSERLIAQCFDKIGQSLDQLANKDRMIQRLIKGNFASDKKKSALRMKLKQLRATL